jgi:hypothetical protein
MTMLKELIKAWGVHQAAWAGLQAFNRLPHSGKRIVFYAETAGDWAFLGPVAQSLARRNYPVVRVCSSIDDPALQEPHSFYVGSGSPRTILFRTVKADAFVMTLPDLDTLQLKRSVNPVCYFYIFHSIASTHRIYRLQAFDAYDTILCVGPHHEREIRRREEVYGLPAKRLLKHGYGRLDTLIQDMAKTEGQGRVRTKGAIHILIAPTWGESSLVNYGLKSLIDILLRAQFRVTLRLHPMTRRHHPQLADDLAYRFSGEGTMAIDSHINTTQSLLDAGLMISEWSGAALDYAFTRLRPVIFIDTPPKINNPEYSRLGLACVEDEIRTKVGRLLPPDQLERVPAAVRDLIAQAEEWAEQIRTIRAAMVYNVSTSGEAGAEAIVNSLEHPGMD